ncbi:leucine--tRNA ligase, partial [Candidatus Dojkabacteria bacterium]|nr:leucine--tRNA ligase [Candidatus Dojkabacteria bacterium]
EVASSEDETFYSLYSFPYPSGAGLHVGHAEGMVANDIAARFYRMQGRKVMLPMGWDSFGLPAENYAIKTGVHPKDSTEEAVKTFIEQIDKLGIMVDWEKEVGAHRPDYYKWTQWFFTQLYSHGLAYKAKAPVNWCPKDQTVLANEQVVDGKCERCDSEVEHKAMDQWFFKITDYADRLVQDLDGVDWPEPTKLQQRNWIGKSEGARITFDVLGVNGTDPYPLEVFTTAHDTIYGAMFMVIAPEHELIQDKKAEINNYDEIEAYKIAASKKTDLERTDLNKNKTGVKVEGVYAINPVNKKQIPIYVADYVLVDYGTGAIMAVPGHDERDYEFAQKYSIPVEYVAKPVGGKDEETFISYTQDIKYSQDQFEIVNSDKFNGLTFKEARPKILEMMKQEGYAKSEKTYRLRDWLISRQRYWGAPIPMIWKKRKPADKVLLIHGIGSSGGSNWFPWLTEELSTDYEGVMQDAEIISPDFPNTELPVLAEWLAMIEGQELTEDSSIVAHSLGCFAALKYAEKNKVKQLVLVAPTNTADSKYWEKIKHEYKDFPVDHLLSAFYCEELDVEAIANNADEIVLIFSTDDPYVSGSTLSQYEEQFGEFKNVEFKYLFNRHHMGSEIECVELPEILPYFSDKQFRVIPTNDLPLVLPMDVDFIPKGYSPLSRSEEYTEKVRKTYGEEWTPEFDTMDTFVCSSWYFFRFTDPNNNEKFADSKELNKWLPADLYMIGAEHIVLHLMYARFFTKFLYDSGIIDFNEPFKKMRHMGIIAGPDGRKMSKRWGNVINPNDVVEQYGADTLRMYEMFMGPLDQGKAWNDNSVQGVRRFLDRVFNFAITISEHAAKDEVESEVEINKLIKKITEDTPELKFNTAVAKFMEYMNFAEKYGVRKQDFKVFTKLLAPYAPYICEYIWRELFGHQNSVHLENWPNYDEELLQKQTINLAVQVMGKSRGVVEIEPDSDEESVINVAMQDEKIARYLENGYKKVIYVPGRIINFIV